MLEPKEIIHRDPEILNGVPVFVGPELVQALGIRTSGGPTNRGLFRAG